MQDPSAAVGVVWSCIVPSWKRNPSSCTHPQVLGSAYRGATRAKKNRTVGRVLTWLISWGFVIKRKSKACLFLPSQWTCSTKPDCVTQWDSDGRCRHADLISRTFDLFLGCGHPSIVGWNSVSTWLNCPWALVPAKKPWLSLRFGGLQSRVFWPFGGCNLRVGRARKCCKWRGVAEGFEKESGALLAILSLG